MRHLATLGRTSFTFSAAGGDYYGRVGRRQRVYYTRAPTASPRYRLLNGLTSSTSPPSQVHLLQPIQTLPDDDFRRSRTPPGASPSGFTPPSASAGWHTILQSTAVLTLIVVASLSLVVGAIYLLIYFKSIKPMSARSRNYMQAAVAGSGGVGGGGGGGKSTDDDGGRTRSTHPFFRRS